MNGPTERRVEFDYLRAAAIVLVVFHHAIIPYTTFAYLNPLDPVKTFSPVVNGERWPPLDVVAWFNDTFLMSLLFLVSGLFVWQSLARRGPKRYIGARLKRLGIPFVLGVILLVPATYYPAQLQISLAFGGDTSFPAFALDVVRSGFGTAGPLWFLWVLLLFDGLVVAFYRAGWFQRPGEGRIATTLRRPVIFFSALFVISAATYIPMSALFGSSNWIGVGPFVAQASRILHYFACFLMGVMAGALGLNESVFRPVSPLGRAWLPWMAAAVISFWAMTQVSDLVSPGMLLGGLGFALSSTTLVAACVALFLRFSTHRRAVLDSLSDNSYGIYIVHYVIITWLQFGLLGPELGAPLKALLSFVGALILSWVVTAALRRVPAIARVL